jgi:hypothetical protein
MTTHTEAYRQLSDPEHVSRIREDEERLTERGRWYVPQDRLTAATPTIRDGDIIAATSTVPGLDIAHTGLALWIDGNPGTGRSDCGAPHRGPMKQRHLPPKCAGEAGGC